jgi:hypothetical protein
MRGRVRLGNSDGTGTTFWSADQNINSTTFGVIGSMFYPERVVQFGVHYRF